MYSDRAAWDTRHNSRRTHWTACGHLEHGHGATHGHTRALHVAASPVLARAATEWQSGRDATAVAVWVCPGN